LLIRLATHKEEVTQEEIKQRAAEFFKQMAPRG